MNLQINIHFQERSPDPTKRSFSKLDLFPKHATYFYNKEKSRKRLSSILYFGKELLTRSLEPGIESLWHILVVLNFN